MFDGWSQAVVRNVEIHECAAYENSGGVDLLIEGVLAIDEEHFDTLSSKQAGTLKAGKSGADDSYVIRRGGGPIGWAGLRDERGGLHRSRILRAARIRVKHFTKQRAGRQGNASILILGDLTIESRRRTARYMNGSLADSPKSREEFEQNFLINATTSQWAPHPVFSVFTQYDQEHYLRQEKAFLCKYKCFHAVSKTIGPKKIIELGVCGGSSADAYLSAAPEAEYLGVDMFGVNTRTDDNSPWDPYEVTQRLFESRGLKNYRLLKTDLRDLSSLPWADFVIVDAAHDFDNAYADLKLALTAHPTFVFVDDSDDVTAAKPAIDRFLEEDLNGLVDYTFHISYVGGGLVIKLRDW